MTMNPEVASPLQAVNVSAFFDTKDVQRRIQQIKREMSATVLERESLIHNMWVARVGGLHLIQVGPGGIAKTFVIRLMTNHVTGDMYFETTVDETTDPSQLYGPPNVKVMVEDGRTQFNTQGMLPEATTAMIDEVMNANNPLLHSLQPILNERVFPNGGQTLVIPLRSCFMGTNWTNPDVALAWFWDRIQLREMVDDIQDRDNLETMVDAGVQRMALVGRGTATVVPGQTLTTVSLEELDQARVESLLLPVSPAAKELFYDLRDEIQFGSAGVRISPRRLVESMAAVKANAWVNGHDQVKPGDLDILGSMWWTLQEQRTEVRNTILTATNPGEKEAMDLLEELDKIKAEVARGIQPDSDRAVKMRVGTEAVMNLEKLEVDANRALQNARDAGLSTLRLEEVLNKATGYKAEVGRDAFGLNVATQRNLRS